MNQLILQDGTVFKGEGFGASCEADGEVVFNTGMVGYPESLTDPSYRGQILVFTYPLIGNYGVPSEELNAYGFSKNFESENIHVRGVVVSQLSEHYSHHNAVSSLHRWLEKHNIPGITGVDTRVLTKKLREEGVMLGALRQACLSGRQAHLDAEHSMPRQGDVLDIEDPNKRNLVSEVSCKEPVVYESLGSARGDTTAVTIVAYDCGMKRNILRSFLKRGVRVIRVPWDYDLASCDQKYDGVFISNGPGNPELLNKTIEQIKYAIERDIPVFGICLGCQLMAQAIGGKTYKMKYGHRGVNQPCLEEGSQRCIISSQNHGYAVDEKLPPDWQVWFRNANDRTVEGIRHKSGRFFAVQFHPEATPGPEDAGYLFDEFLKHTLPHAHPLSPCSTAQEQQCVY